MEGIETTIGTGRADRDDPRSEVGAFRIYAKAGGAKTLIVVGDRSGPTGAMLARIEWFKSAETAEAIARYCHQLLDQSGMSADPMGWRSFPLPHVKTLLGVARNHLHVTFEPEMVPEKAAPRGWTGRRIARLGFLAGQGFTAKAIAKDPEIRSTANNVYRQARKNGISLSEIPQGLIPLRLPTATIAALDRFAALSGMTRDAFLRSRIIGAVADPDRLGMFSSKTA